MRTGGCRPRRRAGAKARETRRGPWERAFANTVMVPTTWRSTSHYHLVQAEAKGQLASRAGRTPPKAGRDARDMAERDRPGPAEMAEEGAVAARKSHKG